MSPSKKVTFNLSRNTYTDIAEIEERLNESTKLRVVISSNNYLSNSPPSLTMIPDIDEEDSDHHLRSDYYRTRFASTDRPLTD